MKKLYLFFFIFLFIYSFCVAQAPQLMGMTYGGGAHACGTIFKINGDGSGFQTIYSFNTATGKNPYGSLIQANDGKLYGMASAGGANSSGVLFRFDPVTYAYNDLFDFTAIGYAGAPKGSLMQATDGKLYGMTYEGGVDSEGVLFSFNPADSAYSKLLDFNDSIGILPKGDLIQAGNGKLYGMTTAGGASDNGVLFSFDLSSSHCSKLVDFNPVIGMVPEGSLVKASNGKLYGTTRFGGAHSAGVLFSYNPADSGYYKLLDFAGGNQEYPSSGVTLANNGKLYGMTLQGGLDNVGSIYSFDTLGNVYKDVLDFDTINGSSPSFNTLRQASDNILYGMTVYGGVNNDGVVFSFNPADSSYTKLIDLNDTTGKYPDGTLLELQITTGIPVSKKEMGISVYPNPATYQLNIHFTSAAQENESIYVTNVLGEVIQTQSNITDIDNKNDLSLNIKTLSPGMYFVKVVNVSAGWQSVVKFVKE